MHKSNDPWTIKSTAQHGAAAGTQESHEECAVSYTALPLSPSLSTGGTIIEGCPEADMDIDF